MAAPAPIRHPYAGALAALAGVAVAVLVYLQPQKLRAPAWVAYAAALAFVLAGLSLLAQGTRVSRRLQAWLGVVLLACLMAPAAWIAVASPAGRCQASWLGWFMTSPQWICRAGFAVATFFGAVIFVVMLRQAIRTGRSE